MKNKVVTFTAVPINEETKQPKQERTPFNWFKKVWTWLKNFFSKRYLVNYVLYTGTVYMPFKDVVTVNELNKMMLEPQIMIYSVVSKKYLSTIHKKVVDSDEKINAHTDISEQLISQHTYGKFD